MRHRVAAPAGILADTQSGSATGIWAASYSGDITIQNGDASSKYSIVGAVSDSDYGTLFGGRVAGIYAETGDGAIGIGNNGIVFAGNGNYGGPCPPVGDADHHYVFTLYALAVDNLHTAAGIPRTGTAALHRPCGHCWMNCICVPASSSRSP